MEQPRIENLMLANHVEAVNGMLYISGGGWTDHWRQASLPNGQPVVSQIGVAVTVVVPWTSSGQPYRLQVSIDDAIGVRITSVATQLNATRPPGLPTGSDLRTVLALTLNVVFPKSGEYRVVATLVDQPPRVVDFRVHDVAPPAPAQPTVN
ncbi:MAG: DUF6941 family protein [Candidatus Dormibacteria bacterium]